MLKPHLNLNLIGPSDLPALLGLSSFASPVSVYNRIVHGIDNPRSAGLEQMGKLGSALEWPVALYACELLGIDPDTLEKPQSIEHPAGLEWARYSLDPICRAPGTVLEVKMREPWILRDQGWGKPGSADVQPYVLAQVQAQMAFLRADRDRWLGTDLPDVERVVVVVGVGCSRVELYPVPRMPDMGEALLEVGERFWVDHVKRGLAPKWDGSHASSLAVAARYPRAGDGIRKAATKREAALLGRAARAKARAAKADKAARLAEQRLCAAIGDGLGLEGGGLRARWSNRTGKVHHAELARTLALAAGVTGPELEALEEAHRGKPFRVLDIKPAKETEE